VTTPLPAGITDHPLKVLVLEDDHERLLEFGQFFEFMHVPSAPLACHFLDRIHFDVVFLDHDLGLSVYNFEVPEPGSGTDVVNWLCRHDPARWAKTLFIVHSVNTRRGAWMVDTLNSAGFMTTRRAYAWLDVDDLTAMVAKRVWPVELERWDCVSMPGPARKGRELDQSGWLTRE